MTSRERVKYALGHKEPDCVPIYDAPWESTVERWRREGLPKNISVEDYFDYDIKVFLPDTSLHFPYKLIEDTEEYIIERNNYGETVKNFKNRSTTPQIIDTPIKNKKDWDDVKSRLTLYNTRALSADTVLNFSKTISFKEGLKIFEKYDQKQKYLIYGVLTGFDLVQRYLGTERLLTSIIDDPAWVKDIFMESAKFLLVMYEYLIDMGYRFDGAWIFDDLGYRNASLISPKHYKDLIFEADRLVCDYFHSKGINVILHSCGCVKELIPYFIDAGIDCLQPLEVKAGMDMVELKKKYGKKMAFFGGIDTRLYSNIDPRYIEDEIRIKFAVAKKSGGYIYHCDHSIPHDVSFSQYMHILDLVKKYGK